MKQVKGMGQYGFIDRLLSVEFGYLAILVYGANVGFGVGTLFGGAMLLLQRSLGPATFS